MQHSATVQDSVWIFGYGSIIWRPNFQYVEKKVGLIRHWTRRFYQGSTDHRGIPGAPGRVVTLLREAEASCWGVAFKVTGQEVAKVLAGLDHRERGGYERAWEPFWDHQSLAANKEPIHQVLVYRADETNAEYLGEASFDDMARQVIRSIGPSGTNSEYVLRLADSLVELGIVDAHVASLASAVRSHWAAQPKSA